MKIGVSKNHEGVAHFVAQQLVGKLLFRFTFEEKERERDGGEKIDDSMLHRKIRSENLCPRHSHCTSFSYLFVCLRVAHCFTLRLEGAESKQLTFLISFTAARREYKKLRVS